MKPVKVGNVSVSSIIEREGPWRAPATMFPSATPEKLAEVMSRVPDFAYDRAKDLLCITYQTFVLRTPQCTALIDTCVGEHQRRPPALLFDKKPWLDGFAQHGLMFEDIDYVFCTHLHVDHVGWNTRLRDGRLVPTFPNAKYVFSRKEYEHWKQATDPGFAAIHEDCVQPIVDAGQALLVDDAYVLSDELSLVPTPGHSPGHVCVDLKSGGTLHRRHDASLRTGASTRMELVLLLRRKRIRGNALEIFSRTREYGHPGHSDAFPRLNCRPYRKITRYL